MTIRKEATLAMVVFLAVPAVSVLTWRGCRERRRTNNAFAWCVTQVRQRNYYGYELAEDFASRFSREQRKALLELAEAEQEFQGDYFTIELGEQPPDEFLPVQEANTVTCVPGMRARFFTAAGLVNLYNEARKQREVLRLEAQIRRSDLIIVDELGYLPFTKTGAEDLFGFFSHCYEQVSLVVTTNLPFAEWPQIFGGDERLTGALLDRLTHRVHIIEIKGDSYRLKKSLERKKRTKK